MHVSFHTGLLVARTQAVAGFLATDDTSAPFICQAGMLVMSLTKYGNDKKLPASR